MKFTQSHEWIAYQNGIGTVGISKYVRKELGEIVHVELPAVGKDVEAGDEVCVLESTKAATDIYAPVSGKIIEVNESLLDGFPVSLNGATETEGWLYKIELSHPEELEDLLTCEEYQKWVQGDFST